MSWSGWQPIEHTSDYFGPAVYELRAVNASRPISIPRFLAGDDRGLLSIGETGSMETRRRQFITGRDKCYGHSEGNLLFYLLLHSPLTKRHPGFLVEYRFRKKADKVEAKHDEARLIKAYVREYGEVPPLNSAIPDRYGDWES